jgi:hypothetical protein
MVGTRPTVPLKERRAVLKSKREDIVFMFAPIDLSIHIPVWGLDRLEILFYTFFTN